MTDAMASRTTLFCGILLLLFTGAATAEPSWKAGVATSDITPVGPMWRSGYGGPTRPITETEQPIEVRVLALEDPEGRRAVLVTLDLVGIDRATSAAICRALHERHGLERSRIALNCSHTHCGPAVGRNLRGLFFLDESDWQLIDEYTAWMRNRVIETVGKALEDLEPASLSYGEGTSAIAVNRRTNRHDEVESLRASGELAGPSERSLPILMVKNSAGKEKAIVIGYACHPTKLSSRFERWCGDYVGFALETIETSHPGATALFWQGCGGDQTPWPRGDGDVEKARKAGRELAEAVEVRLGKPLRPIAGSLGTTYGEIELPLDEAPGIERLEEAMQGKNRFKARLARNLLERRKEGAAIPSSYEGYPVQTWTLGSELRWIFLGGEVVVDYALRFKREYGPERTWVAGYTNDVMAYVPSERVLAEGGYEGDTSMTYYDLPSRWKPGIENLIGSEVSLQLSRSPLLEDIRLYREIEVPESLLVTEDGRRFGGDLRIGDLDGDGRCDFLVYRCSDGPTATTGYFSSHVGGMKPSFLGAFNMDGKVLWRHGSGIGQPSRPMSVAVHDMTGDGAADVICFWHRPGPSGEAGWDSLQDIVVQVRDGRNGEVIREAAPEAITRRRRRDPVGANWVHQRILIANFRGTETPRDFVVKLGDTCVALDENLEVLWTYTTEWVKYSQCPAYIPSVGDIDGDGRDEVNGGYFLLDSDGTPLWEEKLGPNMDSVAIAEWDEGRTRAICSGHGHVVDSTGTVILRLGEEKVPHGQEVRVADFLADSPGPEMVLRWNGHKTDLHVVTSAGNRIVDTFPVNFSPTNVGMEAVYWHGPGKPALLYNGGWLWDVARRTGRPIPGLPPSNGGDVHRMGFYHMIPADLCGDRREEMVLWDPTASSLFLYTAETPDESLYRGYRPTPRQYNPRLMD